MDELSSEEIGSHMKKLRKKAKLSQEDVAGKMGHAPQQYSKWETGKQAIRAAKLLQFYDIMELDLRFYSKNDDSVLFERLGIKEE